MTLLPDHLEQNLVDEACRLSLPTFIKRFFPICAPDAPFKHEWYVDLLCHETALAFSGVTPRLILSLCPRSGKSLIVSVMAVAWWLGHHPTKTFVCASYNLALGTKLGSLCLRVMRHPAYQRMFPKTRLAKATALNIETTAGGGRFVTSPTAGVTGRGGQILVYDDLLDASDAMSPTAREAADTWVRSVALTRRDDPSTGSMVMVGQRLHVADPIGLTLEREGGDWRYVAVPIITEADETYEIGPGKIHHRKAGDQMLADRIPPKELERIKTAMGWIAYSAQYLQQPAPERGNIIMRDWFRGYTGPYRRVPGDRILQAWDCGVGVGAHNDYSVCVTVAINGPWDCCTIAVVDVFRDRLPYPGLKQKIIDLHRQWRPLEVGIEDAGNGAAVIQDLRSGNQIWPEALKPTKSKELRIAIQSAKIEQRRVFLPVGDPNAMALLEEAVAFPSVRHDDMVDALAYVLSMIDTFEGGMVVQRHM